MECIDSVRLAHALSGLGYPASFWQLIAWADYNGVGCQLRDLMRRLPSRTYTSPHDVAASIDAVQLALENAHGVPSFPIRPY